MTLALSILWILAALLSMWGASIMWRGLLPRGGEAHERRCPSCGAPVRGLSCGVCKYEGQSVKDFRRERNWRLFLCGWIPVVGGVAAGYGAEVVRGWFGDSLARGGPDLGPTQCVAIGVAVFGAILGLWSYRGDRPRGRRRCPECWYDMSASELMCPECGHDAKVVKRLYRPRRRMRGVVGGLLLLVASYGIWVTPRVLKGGVMGAVPSWVLIAGVEWWPRPMIARGPRPPAGEDWTLLGRWRNGKLWGIERWWLRHRARSLVKGGTSAEVLRRLVEMLDVRDADLARQTHLTIVKSLADARAAERQAAADTFIWFGMDEQTRKAIEPYAGALSQAMYDPVPAVQVRATWYLWEIGQDREEILRRVFDSVRKAPAGAVNYRGLLYAIVAESSKELAVIIEASRSPDANVRLACVPALARAGSAEGSKRLVEMLDDADVLVAQGAADALAMTLIEADVAVPALVTWWVKHTDARLRFPVEVYQYGDRLAPHMSRIAELMKADARVSMAIVDWLTRINAEVDFGPVIPVLKEVARVDTPPDADEAKRLLGVIEALTR